MTTSADGLTGKACVFSKTAKGDWIEASILTSSDGRGNPDFGFSVAVYDGVVATGAPFAGASRVCTSIVFYELAPCVARRGIDL